MMDYLEGEINDGLFGSGSGRKSVMDCLEVEPIGNQ